MSTGTDTPTAEQSRSAAQRLVDGNATLVAPAAVRVVDLEAPLTDVRLGRLGNREPYRSLMAVARLDGDPLGVATFPVDPDGAVSRDRLGRGLRRQLDAELGEAFARRRCSLPGTLPLSGVPSLPRRAPATPAFARAVSVVVATCSNPRALVRCLRSILLCDYENFEVIVVENRPRSSGTRRLLAEHFPHITNLCYVEEPQIGASRARNAGLALAQGEIVAFTDDDVVVDRGWIRETAESLAPADDVVAVTGLILPLELETDSQLLLEQFASFAKGFRPRIYRLPESREENPLLPYAAGTIGSGANMVVRADVVRQLGGFDTKLGPGTPTTGGEDLDLFIRLLRAGHAVAYEPSAIVWHEHPDGHPRLRRQVYRYGVGLGAMLAKQLIVGPERSELLGAIPAGIRYSRDPGSRKNVSKPADYPASLTRRERLGMLVGPGAYVLSGLIALARALGGLSRSARHRPPSFERLQLPGGEILEVVCFDDRAPVRLARSLRWQRRSTIASPGRHVVRGAACACLAAPLSVALHLPTALRLPAVLAFLCIAPGAALLSAARGRVEAGLVLGVSLGLTAVVAQSMLWLGAWRPRPFLYGVAAVCALPLISALELGSRPAGIAAGYRRLRDAIVRVAPSALVHGPLIAVALALWVASLLGAHLGRIDGLGLLSAMPPTYFVAFALILVGFALAATTDELTPALLGLYVLTLIVVLHGTTPLLYDEPRYAWTYKHLGVIELISATGHANRQIDIYNNWPAFFAANAWLSKLVGLSPIAYAAFAQVFFNLLNVAAVRFALRGLTADERLLWTATFIFVLGNWVGQDYLAPQAFGFALSLVVLGLCLRCGRSALEARSRAPRVLLRRLTRLSAAILPPRGPDDELPPRPLSPGWALVAGGLCFLAVLTSHQLSPVLVILGVAALAVIDRRMPLWVPATMAALEVWWVALAWPFVSSHFSLIDIGSAGGAGAPGRNLAAAPPGAMLSFYAPAAVMGLVAVLALIGIVRRFRQGKRDVAALCLIVAPAVGAGLQSYGGEGPFRAYLFALPWLAFFAAVACARAPLRSPAWRVGLGRLIAASSALGACLLVAYFGQELANRISPDDVGAAAWYELHAPAGSVRLNLAPIAPDRLTARYPQDSLGDPPSLLERAGFAGHRLGAGDLPRLQRVLQGQKAPRTYVVLTVGQENYARLNGLLPEGSAASLAAAMEADPAFRLVYRRPTAWIFEYSRSLQR